MVVRFTDAEHQTFIRFCVFFPFLLVAQTLSTRLAASPLPSNLAFQQSQPQNQSQGQSKTVAQKFKRYSVKANDTIYAIAIQHNLSTQAMLDANPEVEPENLQIGQFLNIPIPRAAQKSPPVAQKANSRPVSPKVSPEIFDPVFLGTRLDLGQPLNIPGVAEWRYDFAEFRTEYQGFQKLLHSQIQQRHIPMSKPARESAPVPQENTSSPVSPKILLEIFDPIVLGAGMVMVLTIGVGGIWLWRRYQDGLPFQVAVISGKTVSPEGSIAVCGNTMASVAASVSSELRQDDRVAATQVADRSVDWSTSLQAVLDQPPSTLPLHLILGGTVFCLVFGAWSWLGQVNEVGHASGRLVPQGETYKIHPVEAGKVARIAVEEGQVVKAGQLLVALDSQLANHEVKRLQQLLSAYQAEMIQKQAQLEEIHLEAETRAVIAAANSQAQKAAIAQAKVSTEMASQLAIQYHQDMASQKERLERLRPLVVEGAISRERLFELEQGLRDRQSNIIRNQGDIQRGLAEVERLQAELTQKQAEGRKAHLEAQQQIKQLQSQMMELNAKTAETQTLLRSATVRLEQRFLYAPVDGTVSSLNIANIGEVVQPGQTIAEIGSQGVPLVLKAILTNQEAGFVKSGMPVQVKFDAYPYQNYGVIPGRVISTSPDAKPDEKIGAVYHVEIGLERDYVMANQQKIQFKPGQTATAEIVIRDKRIIDILIDPIRQLQAGGINL
jgi:HlyD family secretion protein